MDLKAERTDGTVIANATGRIDSSNSRDFHTALEAVTSEDDTALLIDFADVNYISSAGMRVVLLTAKTLQKQDVGFALCAMNDSIREVFRISGFDKIIQIHDTRAEALAAGQ